MRGRLIGKYYNLRNKFSKKISKGKKNVQSSVNALGAIWFPVPQTNKPKIDHSRRIRRYFHFCKDIETHPLYKAYEKGGNFKLDVKADPNGDYASVNFDDIHLESLLTRLRQFLFENELYYIDDINASIREIFGSDCLFEDFNKKVTAHFEKPVIPKKSGIQVFLPNGEEAVGGRNIYELIEMELYTGRIHSQHTADPQSPYFSLADASLIVRKNVTYYLGPQAMNVASNILILRNHILRLARTAGKTSQIQELKEFDDEMKKLGY